VIEGSQRIADFKLTQNKKNSINIVLLCTWINKINELNILVNY